MPKIKATTNWKCINVNCGATNTVGPCNNCGNSDLETYHESYVGHKVICPRCGRGWYHLECPKCGASTPVKKAGLPLSECFVATAAYGSPYIREVEILRQYRDMCLRQTTIGRFVVRLYESISPPMADWISARPFACEFVRRVVMPFPLWLAQQRVKRHNTRAG